MLIAVSCSRRMLERKLRATALRIAIITGTTISSRCGEPTDGWFVLATSYAITALGTSIALIGDCLAAFLLRVQQLLGCYWSHLK